MACHQVVLLTTLIVCSGQIILERVGRKEKLPSDTLAIQSLGYNKCKRWLNK